MNNQISLRINSVKCIDETGSGFEERFGNDEIMLSGFGIDAAANTVQVRPFEIHPHFDDGETKRFSPPKKFVTLSLAAGTGSFPKSCSVGFLLAERDNGDLGTKLLEIFNKLKGEMEKAKKEEEAKKKRRIGVGASASLTSAELAIIWTLVKPIIFKFIVEKVLLAANDDIFPPKDASVTVSSADFTFDGSKVSSQFPIEFRGHDGIYRMTCDWELS